MINANELRIGNHLMDHHTGSLMTVVEVKENNTKCSYIRVDNGEPHTSIVNNEWLHPIPLTEEILWKCSLTYEKNRNVFSFPGPRLMEYEINKSQGKGYSLSINYGTQSIYFHWELVYLHQLQNLYFALTGKELVYSA